MAKAEAALRAEQQKLDAELAREDKRQQEALMAERVALSQQTDRAESERRIKYADEKWSTQERKGSASQRGRHYVRHGPPDELEIYKDKSEAWLYRLSNGDRRIDRFDGEGNFVQSGVKGK